ncbi:MAG: glycoside hydrolase family 3 C-terminal domain-containing protein [Marinilabiliales bacterium]|nr:glycoside hydrolase family 3 C-terminal domain-containing protein [Marinilabiliales bacterium]
MQTLWSQTGIPAPRHTGSRPLQGIRNAVGSDTKILFAASNKADSAVTAAREADVAIVCVGNHPLSYGLGWGQNHVASDGREDVDRQALSLEQEDLVKLVYAANPNTVLVIVSSFPYTINWSKEKIPAILHISQSSQELGNGPGRRDLRRGQSCRPPGADMAFVNRSAASDPGV